MAAHVDSGLQLAAYRWALWQTKNAAQVIGAKLQAAYPRRFADAVDHWHTGDGRADAGRDAASATP